VSGNSGAWGIAMWKDGREGGQAAGITLEGGAPVIPFLPVEPVGSLTLPPEGMGVPPVRSGDVAFAQRDGVVQFGDYYEPRILTFRVEIPNDGCPGCPSAREKVSRLTEEWSRNCDGATLVLLTDCHVPGATQEQKKVLGPYLVHGRPRVAETTWRRSNIGGASMLLRFDCEDARLQLVVNDDPDTLGTWNASHTVDAEAGAAGGGNIHPNYRLEGLTMTLNGGTFNDFHSSGGGPDGGSYFSRNVLTANTTSPMTMDTTPSGTGAIPVVAGQSYTASWWAEKSTAGGPQTRVNMAWYDAGGGLLSTTAGTNMSAATEWGRHSQTFVAPALAAFLKPILAWSGIALVGQALNFAQIWVNQGIVATGPSEIEVVGTLCTFVTFSLFGSLTAPITVYYGPSSFTYNDDIGPGESVTVDTRWGRASLITVDTTQNVSGDYTAPLSPGTHDLSVTTGNPADTGSVRAVWTNAVVSG
jgi:hypothetical protein